jgi:hypothetical protein
LGRVSFASEGIGHPRFRRTQIATGERHVKKAALRLSGRRRLHSF